MSSKKEEPKSLGSLIEAYYSSSMMLIDETRKDLEVLNRPQWLESEILRIKNQIINLQSMRKFLDMEAFIMETSDEVDRIEEEVRHFFQQNDGRDFEEVSRATNREGFIDFQNELEGMISDLDDAIDIAGKGLSEIINNGLEGLHERATKLFKVCEHNSDIFDKIRAGIADVENLFDELDEGKS